ncbi:MAG: M24 family metallopeptidase, partial [Bacteroidota bacterium]
MIHLKTERDIAGLRRAAELVGEVLMGVAQTVAPGVETKTLDEAAEALIRSKGARPAFKGYGGGGSMIPFPASLCISVNDVVVHGIPNGTMLAEGDVVSVDCGVELEGYFGDYAYTFAV